MAKTKISEFSPTPANNTDIDNINIAEGCAPSGINDAIRELMAQLKDFQAGTAGDSFNGPIGSTTAVTGAFTNVTASGTLGVTGVATLGNGAVLGTPASVTLTNGTGLPISTGVSGLGTGVATALAVNVGSAGAPVLFNGALGTPSSGTVTNLTGTASININGTVGATTATTGAFTTLAASGAVTLSGGTANGVAYLNGSKVLTTGSALTFDGSVLTLAPNQITLGSSTIFALGSSSYFKAASTNGFLVNNSADTLNFFKIDTSGNAIFYPAGTEGMRLTSTGLGIGTSSPGVKLDVSYADTAYNAGIRVKNTSNNLASQSKVYVVNDADQYFSLGRNSTVLGSQSVLFSTGAYPIDFYTDSTFRATIDSSGNLGIGTSSVTNAKLKVSGASAGGAIMSEDISGSTSFVRILGDVSSQNLINWQDGTALRFATSTQAYGSFNERMRLDPSGNLGLGVTPSGWSLSGLAAMQVKNGGLYGYDLTEVGVTSNAYYGSSSWRYISSAQATRFVQVSGQHQWFTAASGTAGNAISFTQALSLTAAGNLLLGGTTDPGGTKVLYIGNGTTPGTPTSGGVLYVESGALKYKGSSGTVTTLGAA